MTEKNYCEHEWRYLCGQTGATMCERWHVCDKCKLERRIKTRMRDGGFTCGESKVEYFHVVASIS